MDVFYYAAEGGNLGDDLNEWIWKEVLDAKVLDKSNPGLILGIGTIIGRSLPDSNLYVICGSGVGYAGDIPDVTDEKWKVVFVRGPLTARILGIPDSLSITDGAILLAELKHFLPKDVVHEPVIFMPHLSAAVSVEWSEICTSADVCLLDPREEHWSALSKLSSAKLVLADAMHGAIISDTYRVPWRAFSSSREVSTFKWLDWTLSMGVEYNPTVLPVKSISLLLLEAHLVLKKAVHRFPIESDPYGTAVEHFRRIDLSRSSLKSPLSYPIILVAKLFLKASRIAAKTKVGRMPLFGKRRTVEILRQEKVKAGYLSSEEVFQEKLRKVKEALKRNGMVST